MLSIILHRHSSLTVSSVTRCSTVWVYKYRNQPFPPAFYYNTKCTNMDLAEFWEEHLSYWSLPIRLNVFNFHIAAIPASWVDPSWESLWIFWASWKPSFYSHRNKAAISQEDTERVKNAEKSFISMFHSLHDDEGQLWEE